MLAFHEFRTFALFFAGFYGFRNDFCKGSLGLAAAFGLWFSEDVSSVFIRVRQN